MSAGERLDLDGRVAVVTGGSRGLGLELARVLGRAGASVVIGSRSADSVDAAVATLRAEGLEVSGQTCDVTDRPQVVALRDAVLALAGRLDVWVNNAGVAGVYGPVYRIEESAFLATTDTIIRGTYFGSLAALDAMLPARSGHLVNLLGRGDRQPVPHQAAYASAKTWVRSFTLALAKENAGSGVRVHAFNPGLVRTEMLSRLEAVRGFAEPLAKLPTVVAVLGRSAEDAAPPLLDLLSGDRVEYAGVSRPRLLAQAARTGVRRLRGVALDRPQQTVTEVPDRPSSLGGASTGSATGL